MKNRILTIALFVVFALAIPVAALGVFLTLLWVMSGESVIWMIWCFLGTVVGGTYILSYILALVCTWKENRFSLKSFLPLFHCVLALIYIASMTSVAGFVENRKERFGFAKKDFILVEEEDTHGGFIGDGYYYMILDCSDNKVKASELTEEWEKIPLTENLDWLIYGGEKNGKTRYGLYEEVHIPEIENGCYMFSDRHMESTDAADDTDIFKRGSYNFSFAIYDYDTDTLYYFDYDT